jgi:hypothetical protein
MSRKVMIGGEEKGDWFDAVLSWAVKPTPAPVATKPEKPAPVRHPPKEEKTAAREIEPREQLRPTSGPSEQPIVVPPVRTTPSRVLGYHSCGHLSWASPEQDEAARAEGRCCGNWKHPPNWSVRGLHTPVPLTSRRSHEKQSVEWGWSGLCCGPVTGLYIGGVGNDCRYYHNGPERCVVHGAVVSKCAKTTKTAGPEESEEPDFMDTLTPLPTTGKVRGAVGVGGMKRGRRG